MIVWSKTDRAARMYVQWATNASLQGATLVNGPMATPDTDFTARVELVDLPPGKRIHYQVVFEADHPAHRRSAPILGSFRAPPSGNEDVRIAWSGDTAGQGFGIDTARGGMKTYASIARLEPDLFLHSGDRIYADNPLPEIIFLPDGSKWTNQITPAKTKVAETLADFRGNFSYNFLDEHVRQLHARVPTIVQWDDHEVHNNWYPGLILEDKRYRERRASVLASRARQAMFEYAPMRPGPIHRVLSYGPHLDIFVLDARSFRNPNGPNYERDDGPGVLGSEQVGWLRNALAQSTATWKMVACDQPIGLVIPDHRGQEGFANGHIGLLGREREIAGLLAFIKEKLIRNVVWITADVHYAAAHHYDPARAQFTDFDPFWEFVAGPLHAGTFGPNPLDKTFGPEVRFQNMKKGERQNQEPSAGKQSFGMVHIDGRSGQLRTSLHDGDGKEMWAIELAAEA